MFEDCGDAELLEAVGQAQAAQRAAFARQLLAVGTFAVRRMDQVCVERELWCVDQWEAIAAEVGAELGISRGRASSQMSHGQALIERFPTLGQVFAAGLVDFRIIAAAIFRTDLIQSPEVLAQIDARLAAAAPGWNKLSRDKITELVDWMVIELDPDAVRIAKQRDLDRHIEVRPGQNGTAEIWGEVRGPDAAAFDAKLNALATTVCRDDPRTKRQRRADALGPVTAGATSMACTCGSKDCPATTTEVPATPIVINVLAEAATVAGTSDTPGYLPGYGVLPAASVRAMTQSGSLRPVPGANDLGAEPHYRPSAALTRFLQCRDLTCRWPGCDQRALGCDIDHTVPYPLGPTHPSNTKPYCRIHHLLKTFLGWHDTQLPDGTIVLTSPSGRTYTTTPTGALFFPQLGAPTDKLVLPTTPPPSPDRGLAMPTRKRTRAQDRAYRIEYERRLNHARYQADPPPF